MSDEGEAELKAAGFTFRLFTHELYIKVVIQYFVKSDYHHDDDHIDLIC